MCDGRHEVPAGKVKAIGGLIRRVGLNLVGVHRHLILAVLELSGAAFLSVDHTKPNVKYKIDCESPRPIGCWQPLLIQKPSMQKCY